MKKIMTVLLATLLLVSLTACSNIIPGWPFGEPAPTECSHVPSDWIIEDEATCKAEGSKYVECTVCGEELDREAIAKAEHTIVGDGDCTTADKCSACGEIQVEACAEHKYTDDMDETCDNPGCGNIKHSTEWVVETEATCTTDGLKQEKCKICGEVLNTETIPAAHTGDDDGDCATPVTCTVCGEVKTEAQAEHKYADIFDTTCENDGCTATRTVNVEKVWQENFDTDGAPVDAGWNSNSNSTIKDGAMKITHTAAEKNTRIYHEFDTNAKVTVEFDLTLNYEGEDNQSHAIVLLRNFDLDTVKTTEVLKLLVQRHRMQINGVWVEFDEIWASGTTRKIKFVADAENNTLDVYMDDVLLKEGAALKNALPSNQLVLGAQGNNSGVTGMNAYYDNILVYKPITPAAS